MIRGVLLLAGLLVASSYAAVAVADKPLRDPFLPPADLAGALAAGEGTSSITGGRAGLRGILLAGDKRLVNFGGYILAVGEAANGHELLEVGEDYAVFRHGEEVVTLTLNEKQSNE